MTAEGLPTVVIAGPTASGKSRLALAVARAFAGTVINADSMQVYRDLRILTARPTEEEMTHAPHRLYGEIDAGERCSAGFWRNLALIEIARAHKTSRTPIVVGGTGLYLSALLHGIADIPPVPVAVVAAAQELHGRLGGAEFHRVLADLDPLTAAKLSAGDTQRLVRAYAVARATGVVLSDWQKQHRPQAEPSAAVIVLLPPRDALDIEIDARLTWMFEAGAIDEARALYARHLSPVLPAMKAVGLREIGHFLEGVTSREAALAAAQKATRHFAKRQYTWLRHQLPPSKKLRKLIIREQFSERFLPEILSFIRQFLLTESK